MNKKVEDLKKSKKVNYKNSIFKNAEAVREEILPLRDKGFSIVTTNGCFDILHIGHIQYLSEAALKGDILVVGVNCDSVVRKLKGKNRPIQNEKDRVAIVSALKIVDYAFIFHEDNPNRFIEIIKPDIHVKGGDYNENIIEKPVVEAYGGKINIVSLKENYSTTNIINKIVSNDLM